MTYSTLHHIVLSLLPCIIPPYAFRLMRGFGAQRVGWVLFAVFSSLALLMLLRSWQPWNFGLSHAVAMDLLNFLIPVLLLIGMVHIDTLMRERLRVEKEEQRLRGELETQVKERTAALDTSNGELQQEISLRKQGEQELLKSKEQYRFLFEENPQPMWIFEPRSLRFLAVNRAALRHYGYTNEEFHAMNAKDLCHSSELNTFLADAARRADDVHPRRLWRHCRKDGSVIEVEITSQDLTYSGRHARLALAHDVTSQRLLQKQLLQSQKREVTIQLAGGVADNFARLINAIENDSALLIHECHDSAQAESLKRIAGTASAAAGLTRQLLALVRRHPMQPQALDLNRVLETQERAFARVLGKNIEITRICSPTLPSVIADPSLLEQILRNLVLNARDAMPEGGTLAFCTETLTVDEAYVQAHEESRVGTFVCLTVSDTGCGMTPEVKARMFEPFFTTKPAGKGMGLGLATVQGLVKQHSGWIEASSEPDAGARFSIFFPASVAA